MLALTLRRRTVWNNKARHEVRRLHGEVRLFVGGDSPLAAVTQAAENLAGVTWLGRHRSPDVQSLLRDPSDLAAKVARPSSEPAMQARMRAAARTDAQYTADSNYHSLMAIYRRALIGTPNPSHVF